MVADMDFTNEGNVIDIVKDIVNRVSSEYDGIDDYDIEKNDNEYVWIDNNDIKRKTAEIRITLYTNKIDE